MFMSFSTDNLAKKRVTREKATLHGFHAKISFYNEVHYPFFNYSNLILKAALQSILILLKNEEDSYRHL